MSARVISFSSGKGGVGKTTIVANLGYLWAKQGKKVLVIDGDWTLGKLGISLGVRAQWTIKQVLNGEVSLKGAIEPVIDNLDLLAAPSGVLGFEELSEASRNQLYFEIERLGDDYDLILLDHSSGVYLSVLQFAAAAHQHVVITTTEPTSYTDAYAIMKLLSQRYGVRQFQLIVTMCALDSQAEGIVNRFCELSRTNLQVRVSLLDLFPWEPKLAQSIREQQPFVSLFPGAPLTQKLGEVSNKIAGTEIAFSSGLRYFYKPALDQLCAG